MIDKYDVRVFEKPPERVNVLQMCHDEPKVASTIEEYGKTYFSAPRENAKNCGYLKFVPKPIKEWYFNTQQPKLEAARRNYAHFVPNPNGMKILEIGAGEGHFLKHCGKENAVGIDMTKSEVEKLNSLGYQVHYGDATYMPIFGNETFDLVFCENMIEHTTNGTEVVREIRRVLKNGGTAIIRSADITRTGLLFFADYTHVHPYTLGSLKQLMANGGFEITEATHGTATSFLMRRLGNIAILLPSSIQRIFFDRICPHFSYDMWVIAKVSK